MFLAFFPKTRPPLTNLIFIGQDDGPDGQGPQGGPSGPSPAPRKTVGRWRPKAKLNPQESRIFLGMFLLLTRADVFVPGQCCIVLYLWLVLESLPIFVIIKCLELSRCCLSDTCAFLCDVFRFCFGGSLKILRRTPKWIDYLLLLLPNHQVLVPNHQVGPHSSTH